MKTPATESFVQRKAKQVWLRMPECIVKRVDLVILTFYTGVNALAFLISMAVWVLCFLLVLPFALMAIDPAVGHFFFGSAVQGLSEPQPPFSFGDYLGYVQSKLFSSMWLSLTVGMWGFFELSGRGPFSRENVLWRSALRAQGSYPPVDAPKPVQGVSPDQPS
jgi:hypothetical protein